MSCRLVAEAKIADDLAVSVDVGLLEVREKAPAFSDHLEEAATAVMISGVGLEVIGQMIDPLRKQRNLHVSRTGIPLVKLEIADRFLLAFHIFQ